MDKAVEGIMQHCKDKTLGFKNKIYSQKLASNLKSRWDDSSEFILSINGGLDCSEKIERIDVFGEPWYTDIFCAYSCWIFKFMHYYWKFLL